MVLHCGTQLITGTQHCWYSTCDEYMCHGTPQCAVNGCLLFSVSHQAKLHESGGCVHLVCPFIPWLRHLVLNKYLLTK